MKIMASSTCTVKNSGEMHKVFIQFAKKIVRRESLRRRLYGMGRNYTYLLFDKQR